MAIGLAILITTLAGIRRDQSTLQASTRRLLLTIVLIGLIGNMVACGKGGGLLGTGTPNPYPETLQLRLECIPFRFQPRRVDWIRASV